MTRTRSAGLGGVCAFQDGVNILQACVFEDAGLGSSRLGVDVSFDFEAVTACFRDAGEFGEDPVGGGVDSRSGRGDLCPLRIKWKRFPNATRVSMSEWIWADEIPAMALAIAGSAAGAAIGACACAVDAESNPRLRRQVEMRELAGVGMLFDPVENVVEGSRADVS